MQRLACLLAVAVLSVLVACQPAPAPPTPSPSLSPPATQPPSATAPPAASATLLEPSPTGTTEPGLASVTIRGERFYSNGEPYYPTTNFLSNGAGYRFTHVYFSDWLGSEQRQAMLDALLVEGHNAVFLYTLNEGDYDGMRVTPYENGIIGGAFDEAKIRRWRADLQRMIDAGLRPVIWLFADDSPAIRDAPPDELKRYIEKMVSSFDDLPIMWVLALEVDEYWSKSQSDDLGEYLASLARNPVGLHQLKTNIDYMESGWVEYAVYQYGFGRPWEEIYDDTLAQRGNYAGRPFLAAEYDHDGGEAAMRRGAAAAFAGAAGNGNGAPPGLSRYMASLPDGAVPARDGSTLTLQGDGITVMIDMDTLELSRMPDLEVSDAGD